ELVATLAGSLTEMWPDCVNKSLYLHYAEASPPIQDGSGRVLKSIAPDWVEGGRGKRPLEQAAVTCRVLTKQAWLPDHPVLVETSYCGAGLCSNGTKDYNETDVDCGGSTSCARCGAGKHCEVDGDCASGVCKTAMVCAH